ncbi:MAG: class I SAM-dependent methyltransferase [Bacteroidales bacterium]|nr:class I SAM-dependent methyltransferase [Bacteroidales bacterium]
MTLRLNTKASRAIHHVKMSARHILKARFWRGHGVHSPYVYRLVRHVISVNDIPGASRAEAYRKAVLSSSRPLQKSSFGATADSGASTTLGRMARSNGASRSEGYLLARLAADLKPASILELGTSTGLSTAHLAAACPDALVVSLEGDEQIAAAARENLASHGFSNVNVLTGNIDDTLSDAIALLPDSRVAFAFIDANHTFEATLRYFNVLIDNAAPHAILVFDDIYWSKPMTSAWHAIVADPRVKTSIELNGVGIAIVRQGCQKEHFLLRN